MKTDVVIIGGGAAGCLAALSAAGTGASVLLLERNQKLGRKLYITGKGRCNLTNDCLAEDVLRNTPCNGKFLYSAMTRFPPAAVKTYFEGLGVPLKTERGNRVFPQSDRAADVIDALLLELRRKGVAILQERVSDIMVKDGSVTGVLTGRGELNCGAAVLATGGASYPGTGSTGDGYEIASRLGHTIIEPKPSLVPLETEGDTCRQLQGLSLKNISIQVKNQKGKVVFSDQGELLFTHFGLSGPLILSASAHLRDMQRERYTIVIDLKPALDEQKLDTRLLRDFETYANREFQNALDDLLPQKLIPVIIERSGIAPETRVHSVTRQQRRALLETLKAFRIRVTGPRPLEEAVVTSGGIKVGEIDPGTMASKRIQGLYFAGELIDVDAYTGGFNLQIAWATGKIAGESAGRYVRDDGFGG
ncbi:MAG: FAD-dependent oxidoreductase [Oscillospiraceae bacterium]|nr:FAD-dependent oxidoreductase [Oscillospiraceae bacterium]